MVRRWSCIINISNSFNNLNKYIIKHKVNLFKSSVNFKRFTFKFTKFKRKSLIRLKHRSTFMIYTNIIKFWIKDYIFNKHFLKYQFFNKIFIKNFYFYNFNFIKNKNDSFFYNFNFIFNNFTIKNYNFFYKNSSFFKNAPISSSFFLNTPLLDNTILPSHSSWENNFYTVQINQKDLVLFDFDIFFNLIFNLFTNKIIEIRKIISLLFYFNIVNFKKLSYYVFRNL